MLTGKSDIEFDVDMKRKAAMLIYYMGGSKFTLDYRYHSRPITNKVVYPPYYFEDDILKYFSKDDDNVTKLAMEVIGKENNMDI